ncbi:hypothetical protein BDL97_12G077000 [Sphagnum fallax]|nr:hypothetical protein BDL97_12G077000 [Sphagnum fallax]
MFLRLISFKFTGASSNSIVVAMEHTHPTPILLHNGVLMPRLGLGTFKAKGNEVKKAVQWALQSGYRLIDTASIYKNEVEIGEAVQDANIKRDELFICSKVSPFEHGFEEATQAVNKILDRLGFTYLDLCLIHWPGAAKVDVKSTQNSKLRGETWHALEQLYKQGKCRAIGVSNYNEQHLTELLSSCEIKPMVNQVEVHPWFAQVNLRHMCALHDILLKDELVHQMACKYECSPAQLLLRWGIQNNMVVLPKSVHAAYIAENANVYSFNLSENDMALLTSLDQGHKICWSPADVL